jgi:hypothetical protein
MKTLSLGQAARLREHGKTIFARAISGRFFAGSKEDGGSNVDGAESGRVYPFPAPVETAAELRSRLALAEERLTELKAMLEDMRRDRDAWREQAHATGTCGTDVMVAVAAYGRMRHADDRPSLSPRPTSES